MDNRRLGNHFIKQWREFRGLSLRQMAGRMERSPGEELVSHVQINRIEKGEQPYNEEFLEAAALALDCTVTDLLTRDPNIENAVIEMEALLRAASDEDQQRALRVVREMLRTGTEG